ncbi:MAG: outer membrane lipoprotein carrier protein LolA [Paludibacteraceae bacterium]|nr:outer membrane lipoprotein carrier protein LolA [Paludibacteraceae bacterium]
MFALILSVILSLQADFVQTKSVAMMSEPQVSTGHMTYRAPDYIRWAYSTPQTVVWEIDGDKSNVNPQVQRLLQMIMTSVAGGNTNDPKLQRETKKMFRSVNITMDEAKQVANRVELIEKNGDITIIEFSNVITQ